MVLKRDKAHIGKVMHLNILGTFTRDISMVKELIYGLMALNMLEILNLAKWMDMELIITLKEISFLEIIM